MRPAASSRSVAIFVFLSLLAGCTSVETIKPIYKPKDILHDDSLPGTWSASEKWWILSRYPKHSYLLTMIGVGAGQRSESSVNACPIDMVKIGAARYWFAGIPDGPNLISPSIRIKTDGEDLLVAWIAPDGWTELLESDPNAPPHRFEGRGLKYLPVPTTGPTSQPASSQPVPRSMWVHVVMTGSPKQTREFLIKHRDDPKLFPETARLKRVAPG